MSNSDGAPLTDPQTAASGSAEDVILNQPAVSGSPAVTCSATSSAMPYIPGTEKIDLSKALELRYKRQYSYAAIGKVFNSSAEAVRQKISKFMAYLDDQPQSIVFDELEPTICRTIKAKYYSHLMSDTTIAKSGAYHAAYVIDKINNTQRLTEGKATAIFDYEDNAARIAELEAAMKEYEEREAKTLIITPDDELLDSDAPPESPENPK